MTTDTDPARLRYLLTRMAGMYLPHWNETYRRYHCTFCHSRITRYADLQRPEYHGELCVWIEAKAYLKETTP